MNDIDTLLRQLEKRGYTTEQHRGHWKIRWDGRLVTVCGSTPSKNKRGMANLKARIKRFEKDGV